MYYDHHATANCKSVYFHPGTFNSFENGVGCTQLAKKSSTFWIVYTIRKDHAQLQWRANKSSKLEALSITPGRLHLRNTKRRTLLALVKTHDPPQ